MLIVFIPIVVTNSIAIVEVTERLEMIMHIIDRHLKPAPCELGLDREEGRRAWSMLLLEGSEMHAR